MKIIKLIQILKNKIESLFIMFLNLLYPTSPEAIELDRIVNKSQENCLLKIENNFIKNLDGWKGEIWLYAIFSYKNPLIKELVWQIKFRKNRKYANLCGEIMANKILNLTQGRNGKIISRLPILILPVPIHRKRRKERGFNQCEWLSEKVFEILKKSSGSKIIYEPNLVWRKIYKQKQSWSKKKERFKNMSGIFEIDKDKLLEVLEKNKKSNVEEDSAIEKEGVDDVCDLEKMHIIIIDDVYTTGATAGEICKILKKHRARNILILTIAK